MPVVFSPGETETRPLDPDAIVYTTAQKVADLLGIGPGEAVLMAANAEANAVFVTGSDYRNHGFSVSDILLIYSDTDPMGQEVTVTAITSTTSGVKLTFTVNEDGVSSINPGLYETADNGYVQNQASFTNGKLRGMKKSVVETRIKEVQDRIDNYTHNDWRPYLASAEYLNFDTYKPYRRRYYTDYVGTTPLLFRNVQQILSLEVWQGSSYRQLCAAEMTLSIEDHYGLASKYLYLHTGKGTAVASLQAGTGNTNWRAEFDNVSTAQNITDLINKEDRVSKAAIDFSGITVEDNSTTGTAQLSVHHEFMAVANADYGSAKIKLRSMRAAQGGKNASVASSDLTNLTFSDGVSGTIRSQAQPTSITINNSPGGYNANTTGAMTTSSGANTKFTVGDKLYNANNTLVGTITGVASTTITISTGTLIDLSHGETLYTARLEKSSDTNTLYFNVDDVDNVVSGGGLVYIENGATTRVAHYSAADTFSPTVTTGHEGTITLNLGRLSTVADLVNSFKANVGGAAGSGTKDTVITQQRLDTDLPFQSGTSGDKARLKDWWLDHEMGIIYFNNSYPFFEWNAVKATYIYGERYLEKAIEEAATKMVAADLLMSDDRSVLIPEGSQNVDLGSKIQLYRKEAMEILSRYKEVVVFS